MSEECNHDCSSCSADCSSRSPESFLEKPHEKSSIKKVIGVVSGKGGVGKSMISSMLAVNFQRKGYHTAILDADITGPSIPKAFGITARATGNESGIDPVVTKTGIQTMSVNLLLEDTSDPVIWRGPVIAGTVKQFWQDVIWTDVDYMFVDMPPGTGDVALTVLQTIPVNGVIMISTPQPMVSMIVSKAVNMCKMMNIKVLGAIENMSYVLCPDCHKKIQLFDTDDTKHFLAENDIELLGELPKTAHIAKIHKDDDFDASSQESIDQFVKPITDRLIQHIS